MPGLVSYHELMVYISCLVKEKLKINSAVTIFTDNISNCPCEFCEWLSSEERYIYSHKKILYPNNDFCVSLNSSFKFLPSGLQEAQEFMCGVGGGRGRMAGM